MPSVLDEILAADRARTAECGPFPLRGESAEPLRKARERINQAVRDLRIARDTATDDIDDLVERREQELTDAEQALDGLLVDHPAFTVELREILPPERVDELMAAHPPTAEQKKAARAEGHKRIAFNEQSFPVAYLAEAIVAVKLGDTRQTDWSPSQVKQLWAKLAEPDRNLLFGAAWMLRSAPTLIGSLGKD